VYEGSQFQLLVFVWCSLLKTLHIGVTHVKCIARKYKKEFKTHLREGIQDT